MILLYQQDQLMCDVPHHFIRDAVIRAAHRRSFGSEADPGMLDEKVAAAESLKAANEVVGEPGALVEMTFTQIASQSNG